MTDRLNEIVKEIAENTQCNCDLDNWQPERNTGHSWVCTIHKKAISRYQTEKNPKK
jgi:hypothetical protein